MTTLRKGLLPTIEQIRKSVRLGLDQCPNQLTIVQRTWPGGHVGKPAGGAVETTLIAFERYLPIRYMTDHEVAEAPGRYSTQDVMVSRITPADGLGHGYTRDQLQPLPAGNGVEIIYRVSGEGFAGDYAIIDLRVGGRASHPGGYSGRGGVYSYALILRSRRS